MYHPNVKHLLFTLCWLSLGQAALINPAIAAPDGQGDRVNRPHLKITVTSNQDSIAPDNSITLREAISLANGDLKVEALSTQERIHVQDLGLTSGSRIEFKLPAGQTKIFLTAELPAINLAGVSIDGTTQSGYIAQTANQNSIEISTPIIEITPADNIEIARGISILADDVAIKGLSIYGFQVGNNGSIQKVPAGDIFISNRTFFNSPSSPALASSVAPKNVTIEHNFLGIKPDRNTPIKTSDFGIYAFNSDSTIIRHNLIKDHTASGIITSVNADNLLIKENILIGNGTDGMPDAIRLEGDIRNNKIDTNLICANDGSGIFLFKPAIGAVDIRNNTIKFNGRRFRRAAIYVMGSDNHIVDNNISNQAGSGVSVSAFTQPHGDASSARNIITGNRFAFLEGLSVDLNSSHDDAPEDFQNGDGINPPRNSENRRLETGNMAINAPKFLSRDFLLLDNRVNIDGVADAGSKIQLYKVSEDLAENGPLSLPLATVTANSNGKFAVTLSNLQPGERISAIATDPIYGTSEPARNSIVITPGQTADTTKPLEISPRSISQAECAYSIPKIANTDSKTVIAIEPTPGKVEPIKATEPPVAPQKIKLSIPANIHFALDKSNIAPMSAEVIDRIAKVLKDHPYIVVEIEGHTDPRANNDYNQRLGMRRAMAARKYLVSQGIDSSRITIRSYGKSRIKAPHSDVVDYAKNRRAEFLYRDIRGIELEVIEQEGDLQLEHKFK